MTELVAETSSAEATQELGAALAEVLRAHDVLVLSGDLGAGKTALTQGIGRGLGIDDQITSPTFTLLREYTGRLDLFHLDVYRLEALEEVRGLGLPELLDERGVVVVEWGDTILPALPADHLEVVLTLGPGDDDRRIVVRPSGPLWHARQRALRSALQRWLVPGPADGEPAGSGG